MIANINTFRLTTPPGICVLALLLLFAATSCRQQKSVTQEHVSAARDDVRLSEAKDPAHSNEYSFFKQTLGFEPSEDSDLVLLWEVSGWMGVPYKFGGKSKSGVDCSGLALQIYRNVYNFELRRQSIEMAQHSKKIRSPERLLEGDLVFFRIDGRKISHVGIYLGDGRFVHASTSQGVTINRLNEPYYSERFAFGGRITR